MKTVKTLSFLILVLFLFSCKNDTPSNEIQSDYLQKDTVRAEESLDILEVDSMISNYDLSTVNTKDRKEFKDNLKKIEQEYGVQWSFCTCAIKKDSVSKAINNSIDDDNSENKLDQLMIRLEFIDQKCEAFKIQDPNRTPEDREKHKTKIKNCLKEAGIK